MPTRERWAAMTADQRKAYTDRARDLREARRLSDPEWAEAQRARERERSVQRRRENPEQIREWQRKANAKHYANNAEKRRAQRRAYRAANAEKEAAAQRRYRASERGRELARQNAKAYRERNPALARIRAWRQRGARSGADAWVSILLGDPCSYCGNPMEEVDHITPVASGGDGEWSNLAAACQRCNRSKKNHPLLLWIARSKAA